MRRTFDSRSSQESLHVANKNENISIIKQHNDREHESWKRLENVNNAKQCGKKLILMVNIEKTKLLQTLLAMNLPNTWKNGVLYRICTLTSKI